VTTQTVEAGRVGVRLGVTLGAPTTITVDADASTGPFWSPDSRFIAFLAQGKLKKIGVAGGEVVTLCDVTNEKHTPNHSFGSSGDWNRDDVILFTPKGNLADIDSSPPSLYRPPDRDRCPDRRGELTGAFSRLPKDAFRKQGRSSLLARATNHVTRCADSQASHTRGGPSAWWAA